MIVPGIDPWLVLRTRSRHENVVESVLQQKQIVAYLPRRKVVRKRQSCRSAVDTPLFPGYVFVRPRAEQYECMRYIRGSCGLVLAADNKPATMPERDVEAVKILVQSGTDLSVDATLVAGRRVRIGTGPLMGVEGELISVKSRHLLVINVDLVSSSVRIEVDKDEVTVL